MARYEWFDAVNIVRMRRVEQSELLKRMVEVKNRYNGEYTLPIPVQGNDVARAVMVSQLVDEAIDQPAMRAASVMPNWYFPAVNPTKASGPGSRQWAQVRRRAVAGTLANSDMNLILRRGFRHIGGYGSASLLVMPNDQSQEPRIVLRDPLTTYGEQRAHEDTRPPTNIGYVHQRSGKWLVDTFGQVVIDNWGDIDKDRQVFDTELWDCLEWVDEEYYRIGIMGPSDPTRELRFNVPHFGVEIGCWPNLAGKVPAVCPTIITLDKVIARVHHMLGKVDTLAYLLDLDLAATKKAIFPDRYVLSEPGKDAELISGPWQTGETGQTNILKNARSVGELRAEVSQGAFQRFEAIEQRARQDAGLVGPQTGQTSGMDGMLRTGKGINDLMGVAVDPRIQEMHEIMASSLRQLTGPLLDVYEGYWPTKKFVMFTGWPGDNETVSFTPNQELAENHDCAVSYAIPGADVSQVTVALGQLVGTHLISEESARVMHPWIGDPETEHAKIVVEQLSQITLDSLRQRAAAAGIPPVDMAIILHHVREGMPLEEAIARADANAQARQAAQAPQGAPETQPGLANPGEGAEQQALPPGQEGSGVPQQPLDLSRMMAALAQQPGGAEAGQPASVAVK